MAIFFILPLIPLISGVLTLINYFRQKHTSLLSNVFSGLLFVCAWLAAFKYTSPLFFEIPFFKGASNLVQSIELQLDGLALYMVVLVSSISFFVHQFASRYLKSDVSQGRFMAQLSLLTSAVIFLVMGGNLLTCFLGWEFVGLTLYLLLNHYHYDGRANRAAKKEFIINRCGDMAFMIALTMCLVYFNSTDFTVLGSNPIIIWQLWSWQLTLQSFIVFLIFIAIMTKSAQFPFHIWLPDTMQAPTPVSAMMHAGIINVGGFLLARLSPYIPLSSVLSNFIYTVGMVSVLTAAFFGLSQNDVKRQLAYSTMGQMGYMIVQAGLGFFTAAVFHLAAHGFFKGYLFLSAGNKIGHKYEYNKSSLRKGIVAIKIFILTFIIFGAYNQLVYHSLKTSVIILGMFISLAIGQYMSEVSMFRLARVQKVIIYAISLIFLIIYAFLINSVDDFLHSSVLNQVSNVSWYKLSVAILVMLIQIIIWLNPLFKNDFSTKLTLRAYYLSVNKLFVEESLRKYFLQPYIWLSLKLNRILVQTIGDIPLLAILGGAVSAIIFVIGVISPGNSVLYTLFILVLLMLLLITAYKANTLAAVNYYLFLAQLNMVNLGVNNVHIAEIYMRDLAFLQLVNATLIFISIEYIKRQQAVVKKSTHRFENKLIWSSFYYCILMFLWIGVPLTGSFISEIVIFKNLILDNPHFVWIAALCFVFLAMAILNALQEYVFNPDSEFLNHKTQISLSGHIFLTACIGFNILNGIAPSLLVHQMYMLGITL